jgi:Acyl-CoA dehydrogenase, C-terminal domain
MSDTGFLEDSLRWTAQSLFAGGAQVDEAALSELGWTELMDEHPALAVGVLAEEQGRALGRSRLVEMVMASVLGLDSRELALGFALGATACPDGVDAVLLAGAELVPSAVIPVRDGSGVALAAATFDRQAIEGVDPDLAWTRVRGEAVQVGATLGDVWRDAVALGSLALAHERIGVAAVMLDLAVEHVGNRQQFGVPIGSFQAVQHRLANVFVQAEAARAIARTAWLGRTPELATAALVAAQRAVGSATEHCQQVLGAMGCTWEHPMHRYIRRGIALAALLDPDEDLRALAHTAVLATNPVEVLA